MSKVKTNLLCLCLACPLPLAAQESTEIQKTLSWDTIFATFDEKGEGDSGDQLFTRFQYTHSTPTWDLGIATGYLKGTRSSNYAGGSGSVNTLSDTSVSASYRAFSGNLDWLDGRRATFALNADVNLPTGQNKLSGEEKNAVFDSFLVDQDRYGEGLNIGVGFGSTVTLNEHLLMGLGASYIFRGDFNPDGDDPDRTLAPGDQFILSAQLLKSAPAYQWNLGYRLIDERETKVDGLATYDRSLSHELFGSATFQISDDWTVQGSALYATRGADKSYDPISGQLVEAPQDDNGDTYFMSIGATRRLSAIDQIGVSVSRRMRGENEFDEADFSFQPSLRRDTIGVTYDRQLKNNTTVSGGISYFTTKEGTILGYDGPKYNGVAISLGVSHAF